MINLKIDPEFQNQIPPLTDDEYKQLEENIQETAGAVYPVSRSAQQEPLIFTWEQI